MCVAKRTWYPSDRQGLVWQPVVSKAISVRNALVRSNDDPFRSSEIVKSHPCLIPLGRGIHVPAYNLSHKLEGKRFTQF